MKPGERPRVCLFVGPSLPADEIRSLFRGIDAEVRVLPPATQGDILRLIEELPDIIGIVDGYFFHRPALLHREILLALERGARVVGASSLGALRAAELDVFGMEGIGEIYRLYRRGVIDGDDEVAVLHAPSRHGFRPVTEALVDLRHNVWRARRRRIISSATAGAVLARARSLHFTRRTYEAVLDERSLGAAASDEVVALRRFLRDEAVSLKREDALTLVRTIVERVEGSQLWPPSVPVRVQQTTHFHRYHAEYVGRSVDGQHVPDELVVSFQKLLSPSFPSLCRRVALRCLALDEAAHRGVSGEDPELLVARFRSKAGLRSDEAFGAWLRRRCLTYPDQVAALRERDLEERLLALYRTLYPSLQSRAALQRRITSDVAARAGTSEQSLTRSLLTRREAPWSGPLMGEMKLRGSFRPALRLAGQILRGSEEFFERDPSIGQSSIWRRLLGASFARRWNVDEADLEAAIRERGFAHPGQFFEAAAHVFAHEQTVRPRAGAEDTGPSELFYAAL